MCGVESQAQFELEVESRDSGFWLREAVFDDETLQAVEIRLGAAEAFDQRDTQNISSDTYRRGYRYSHLLAVDGFDPVTQRRYTAIHTLANSDRINFG